MVRTIVLAAFVLGFAWGEDTTNFLSLDDGTVALCTMSLGGPRFAIPQDAKLQVVVSNDPAFGCQVGERPIYHGKRLADKLLLYYLPGGRQDTNPGDGEIAIPPGEVQPPGSCTVQEILQGARTHKLGGVVFVAPEDPSWPYGGIPPAIDVSSYGQNAPEGAPSCTITGFSAEQIIAAAKIHDGVGYSWARVHNGDIMWSRVISEGLEAEWFVDDQKLYSTKSDKIPAVVAVNRVYSVMAVRLTPRPESTDAWASLLAEDGFGTHERWRCSKEAHASQLGEWTDAEFTEDKSWYYATVLGDGHDIPELGTPHWAEESSNLVQVMLGAKLRPIRVAEPMVCRLVKSRMPTVYGDRVLWSGEQQLAYPEAERECQSKGGHLVSIHSEHSDELLARMAGQDGSWFGLQMGDAYSEVKWTDGSLVDYVNPTVFRTEKLAENVCFAVSAGVEWLPLSCDVPRPFVCGRPASLESAQGTSNCHTFFGDDQSTREDSPPEMIRTPQDSEGVCTGHGETTHLSCCSANHIVNQVLPRSSRLENSDLPQYCLDTIKAMSCFDCSASQGSFMGQDQSGALVLNVCSSTCRELSFTCFGMDSRNDTTAACERLFTFLEANGKPMVINVTDDQHCFRPDHKAPNILQRVPAHGTIMHGENVLTLRFDEPMRFAPHAYLGFEVIRIDGQHKRKYLATDIPGLFTVQDGIVPRDTISVHLHKFEEAYGYCVFYDGSYEFAFTRDSFFDLSGNRFSNYDRWVVLYQGSCRHNKYAPNYRGVHALVLAFAFSLVCFLGLYYRHYRLLSRRAAARRAEDSRADSAIQRLDNASSDPILATSEVADTVDEFYGDDDDDDDDDPLDTSQRAYRVPTTARVGAEHEMQTLSPV